MSISISSKVFEKPTRCDKGASLVEIVENYVVLDLETTGLDPQRDSIIETAAVRVMDGKVIEEFQSLINPMCRIDSFITELTGITNEMLAEAPLAQQVLPAFLDFIGDSVVVAHNANFDVNFLYDGCTKYMNRPFRNDFIDTMRFSRRLFREHSHHRLCDLIERFGIGCDVEHRALADVWQTHQCYEYMKAYIPEHNLSLDALLPQRTVFSVKDVIATTDIFDVSHPVFGKTFVFTGTLERMPRREAMLLVVNLGGKCGDSINKMTNYLVLGNNDYSSAIKGGKSNKHKKAEELRLGGADIEIISENVFYDMIGD